MFFISVLLVAVSSYFILECILALFLQKESYQVLADKKTDEQKTNSAFFYLLLIAFSQVIFSFEILSLFKSISKNGFLLLNIIFFIVSIILLLLRRKTNVLQLHFQSLDVRGQAEKNIKRIFSTLKKDKTLKFLSICFSLFLIFQIIRILFDPVTFGDALAYYLPRCSAWIQNGSILHYTTPDTRELIMPVNMEFLYTWLLLFRKSEAGIAIFSFIGYLGAVYVIYSFLKELNFSIKRRLWTIYAFSSFALVIIEMISPCADLFIGTLILGSIYLFLKALKYNDKIALYFSSLSYALAIGTKTTALIAIPSVFLIFCALILIYKKNFLKTIFAFGGFFLLNFIIFSSYNYILNIIQFSNPVSCSEQLLLNQFRGGFKGYISNLIKYIFAFFDMSGMPEFININGLIEYWQTLVLSLFGTNIKAGTSNYFNHYFTFNNKISLMNSSLGVMGFLAFLPSVVYSIKRMFKHKTSKNGIILGILSISFIFNILLFSRVMVYTGFNMRYLLTFAIIAVPSIVYSYPKLKFCKILFCLILFIYFIGYAHHEPVVYLLECLRTNKIIKIITEDEENDIYKYFMQKQPVNIALLSEQVKIPSYYIEKLRLHNFKIQKILPENIETYDLSRVEYIITLKNKVSSTNIVNFEERIKYPEAFVSRCLYNDKNQNIIYFFDKKTKPAIIECEIPFMFLKSKGFEEDKAYKSSKYIILKRTSIL